MGWSARKGRWADVGLGVWCEARIGGLARGSGGGWVGGWLGGRVLGCGVWIVGFGELVVVLN